MKPSQKKKLALSTETLRSLSEQQLGDVGGAGFTDISGSCSCNSCICSYFGNCGPVIKPATGGGGSGGSGSGW